MSNGFRILEINGGRVTNGQPWYFWLPQSEQGYVNAQIDDYGGLKRKDYRWRRGTTLHLRARFSHSERKLVGTAGFGFWNAPFGDPTIPWPTLPQATWFFFASEPSDFPLSASSPGRGWFASTIDASAQEALFLIPFAPVVILLNHFHRFKAKVWPCIQSKLGMSFSHLSTNMAEWHTYKLSWQQEGCRFFVDDDEVLSTCHSPRGPLGFVCWIDNQYLVTTPTGQFRWGQLSVDAPQWLEVSDLFLSRPG